ncbi:hypothetical protein Tco_0413130 [Tanacetum coccineum]
MLCPLGIWLGYRKSFHAVKRVFRYLKGTVNRGLWYPKDSLIALTGFADADHAGCQDTCCSTSRSMQFLGDRLVSIMDNTRAQQKALDDELVAPSDRDGLIQVTTDENGVQTEVPPKTAQVLLQRQRERKAKSIFLLAIPDEYQLRFHGIKDAKSLWAAIKSRFGGNPSRSSWANCFIIEDANQKILRALPSSWNNVALIMRNKDGIDDLDIDDLYNNLKVFEADIKGSPGSSSNSQNVAFLSTKDTSSSNEVNTANGSNSPQLDNEDLEQIDHDDLEKIDLKWQVAMLSMRVKRFYKKTGRKLIFNGKEPVGFDKTKDNALIIQDGLRYDWSYIAQDEPTKIALMAYTSNSSGSDTEEQSCSKNCVKTYEKLQKQFDEQRQTLSKANLEIVAYQLSLESVEAQLVVHQKNEVVFEEKIAILEFKVKDKNKNWSSRSSDGDDNQTNDRFKKDNGYHVDPPPLIGNYMPPLADLSFAGLDDSVYRNTSNKTSASVSQVEKSTSQTSNTNVEMPRVESVRPSEVIIEDLISDDDEDIFQSNDLQATDKPSFKRIEFTNARNESVKPKQAEKPRTITQNPKVNKRDWNGKMTQKLGLGFGFTKKACFVCGNYNHLIKGLSLIEYVRFYIDVGFDIKIIITPFRPS